jgi:hypothetical protein
MSAPATAAGDRRCRKFEVSIMLALTDHEMQLVMLGAAMVPPSQRDAFLRSIANRLREAPGGINEAIAFTLSAYDISIDRDAFR